MTGGILKFPEIEPSLFWAGGAEVTVLRIEWEAFTNDEISAYFRKWVKASRPKRIVAPDGKGQKLRDWRAKLTRLGAMRIMAHCPPAKLLDAVPGSRFAAVWETKQFAGAKWLDITKWYDARRQASKELLSLFPFLSKEDKPLSLRRRLPRK